MAEVLEEMYELIEEDENKIHELLNEKDTKSSDILYGLLSMINKCILMRNLLKDMMNSESEVLQSERDTIKAFKERIDKKLSDITEVFKSRVKSDKIGSDDMLKLFMQLK